MNQHRRSFTRRTMLRGLGVSMALPWMESLHAWGTDVPASLNKSEAPVRLAILFGGNGFHKEWWAEGKGTGPEAGQSAPASGSSQRQAGGHSWLVQCRGAERQHHSSQLELAVRCTAGCWR